MRSRVRSALCALVLLAPLAAPAMLAAQVRSAPVSADSLRAHLFVIADDSMGGRDTGSPGDAEAADWVAAAFARYGLTAAGENGTFFQVVPFWRVVLDSASGLDVNGTHLAAGRDVLPVGILMTWRTDSAATLYAGAVADSTTWPAADRSAGKLLLFRPAPDVDLRATFRAMLMMRRNPRFAHAAGFAFSGLDSLPPQVQAQIVQSRVTTDTMVFSLVRGSLFVTTAAASVLLGRPLAAAAPGQTGPRVSGSVAFKRTRLAAPARNVIALLPGGDSTFRNTYVSISAHHDHIGFTRPPLDHDSVRAFNRVVRPMGDDSPPREASPEEAARVAALRDSLHAAHPAKLDSIYNGADDDGSGTVALVELARVLASGPRPKRSILFISHAAEERGLQGSRWFTDHPTVPRDSIVAELDMDMVGRGGATDLPHGGPGYLELVGSRRLSTELGNLIEAVAAAGGERFHFNYEYDAPNHPLQYYCRADDFSYARYGIPSASLSTGEHLDYHQITDEPQYIDYAQLARVTTLVRDVVLAVANLDHRPAVDGPRPDPRAPCRQ
ncbi:MAG TPA: M28 family peptidase [Gemmatimonadales bacterium]|nr:M28 family peptidase [Gemmatimonadales bacterium]